MKSWITVAGCLIILAANAQTKKAAIQTAALPPAETMQDKKTADRECIKAMCGIYKVSFSFAETFSPDTAYQFHKRYNEWGIEYVFVAEETSDKISLQHLLIVNDSVIVKHWRQDWVYENREVYQYYKNNEWIRKTITEAEARGTWTQKVYQVDDSPRYESYGTWVHIDGKHFWEGVNDSPLPRREFTKRNDYNVLKRHSRIEVLPDGWVLNQDNEKIIRSNGIDKLLCWEKGIEKFTRGNYDPTPAQKWWNKQVHYWADVRKVWAEVYAVNPALKLDKRVGDKFLFEALMELGDAQCVSKPYVRGAADTEIRKVITAYLKA